jgi:muconolactone delta-isomerase
MEYLVTMTTHVPHGVSDRAVDEVRAREAEHTRELAAQGRVRRLWRPPLKPDEWRTLGLFEADDADDLEKTLSSMPLRVWRTDEVTPLAPHANDPGIGSVPVDRSQAEFLTFFTINLPSDVGVDAVREMTAREATRTTELAAEGHLVRLWRLPGSRRNLGHWQAEDIAELKVILSSLPMAPWLGVETVPLTRHPSDPLSTVGRTRDAAAQPPAGDGS